MEERGEHPTMPDHVHDYYGRTSVDREHFHTFAGSTRPSKDVPGHVHDYADETRAAQGHTHQMSGTSGPAVPILMGHTHQIAGTTAVNDHHTHTYDLYTGYSRAPRNVRRHGIWATAVGEKETKEGQKEEKEEGEAAAAPQRPRLRFRFRNPSSEQK